jgi:tryptophan-rich sensory protein
MMGVLTLTVLGSTMSWSTLFFIVRLKIPNRSGMVLQISTVILAVVVTCLSAISSYLLGPRPMNDPGENIVLLPLPLYVMSIKA